MLVGEQLGCPEGAARFALAAVHAVRRCVRARRARRAAGSLALPCFVGARARGLLKLRPGGRRTRGPRPAPSGRACRRGRRGCDTSSARRCSL